MEWYRKAEKQNYAEAVNNIGVLYENGEGVTINYNTALSYYEKANKLGNAGAKKYYNNLKKNQCTYCGSFFTKVTESGIFSSKTICKNCCKKWME